MENILKLRKYVFNESKEKSEFKQTNKKHVVAFTMQQGKQT